MDQVVLNSPAAASLAHSYKRLGWIGFWSQVIGGAIPLVLMIYLFAFARATVRPRAGFAFVEYVTIGGFFILAFTTVWFFRHARLAKRIGDPERGPSYGTLIRATWIGIVASVLGILFSILVMLIEVAHLLFYFLATPQGGVQVVQTTASESASWVSAVDMLSLMALLFCLVVELLVLTFGLWLLYRTLSSATNSKPVE